MKAILTRYWKISLIIVFVVAGIIFWSKNTAAQKANTSITTAKVTQRNFVKTLSSSGKTQADKSVELKFQTSGKLAWVGVKEGDRVQAYQALAGLDVREVQKNLEKALRDYSNERNDFEEARQITYGTRKTDAVNNLLNDTVARILEKNQWDLDKAVLDVELKSLAVEFASLTTPIAGIVTHIDTPIAGVNITPATSVFAVADPESLIFEANVDEVDVGGISIGQPAIIKLDAFPESTFSGTIAHISYVSEQSSGGATVFPVKVAFTDPQQLRVGLNGDITIETGRQDNVLTIPTEALREENNTTYVYKKTGKTYQKVTVTTGAKNEDDVIITSGLNENDLVVTKGFTSIPK